MPRNITHIFNNGIKFFLIPFILLTIASCKNVHNHIDVHVDFENEKAISITFISDKAPESYQVYIYGNDEIPVLGSFLSVNDSKTFRPIIPFSSGQQYELKCDGEIVGSFAIPKLKNRTKPELLTIYPSRDTVPENLLKMYFVFSHPMQEVKNSLNYITVKNIETGKEESIFLELQPELWNKEHTHLTLWLDPGRIKTNLIPNKEQGLPIIDGSTYEIKIASNWKDSNGNPIGQEYNKQFFVTERDTLKPALRDWKLYVPNNKNNNTLKINFNESMDAILARETIHIFDSDNNSIDGAYVLLNNETALEFTSNTKWEKGRYRIQVESKLEDLAGNNFNHLFDVDLEKESFQGNSQPNHVLYFNIQ